MTKPALILFIRNPELGKVKTRLARDVGDEQALSIYKALLKHTRDTALAVNAQRLLFYSQAVPKTDHWPTPAFTKLLQAGDDLGERMHLAFLQALERAYKAVIIGSVIAQINAGIIEEAFQALEENDYVIGPALDGGYYLLGMKQPTPELFQNMEWSTPDVCQTTLDRISRLGRSCHKVATLTDIDYAEDWKRHGWPL